MKAKRIFTQNPAQAFEFWTFGELDLMRMLWAANHFAGELSDPKSRPRWISFWGASGLGKSYLARRLSAIARKMSHLLDHPTLIPGAAAQLRSWPEVVDALHDWESGRHLVRELVDCNFLVLDEVGGEFDKSGWKAERLLRILEGRKGKWTVVTGNLTLKALAELDQRIASRLIRDANEVIEVDALDYALRPERDRFVQPCVAVPATQAEYDELVARWQRLNTLLSEAREPDGKRHAVNYFLNAVIDGEEDERNWVWTVQE